MSEWHQVWKWSLEFGGKKTHPMPVIAGLNTLYGSTINIWTRWTRTLENNQVLQVPINAVVQKDENCSMSCLVLSLLHVLITYYVLQKIIFEERISEWFSFRNRIWQHAQSAFMIGIQGKSGTELVDVITALLHHASCTRASTWIWRI